MLFWLNQKERKAAREDIMGSRAARMLALGILALAPRLRGAGRGAGRLSEQDRDAGGAVSARRRRRRAGARRRRKALRRARPSGDRRQSRRRLGPRRHARGDPQRAGRLHAVPRPHRLDLDQSEPLRQLRFRSAQGLHRDRPVRLDAGRAARASVVSRPRPSARWSSSRRRRAASSTSARRRSAPAAISRPSCSSRSPACRRPSCPTRAPRS